VRRRGDLDEVTFIMIRVCVRRAPWIALGVFVAACRGTPTGAPAPSPVPSVGRAARSPVDAAAQIIVVTTADWDSTSGTLRRFERTSGSDWRPIGTPTAIVTGRTGLAWGVGFDSVGSASVVAPHKHEGDGRSPAGVFPLDTLFGYDNALDPAALRLPYVTLTGASDCVDDEQSLHYNTVVSRDVVPRIDWNSAEHMRSIGQYRIGVIVGYNAMPPVPGRGSCIFLHIWAGASSTTAGCTALDASALADIVRWLDRAKRPMLVQLTSREYERLRGRWGLPAL
jgi:L,D-peptidoglycan transpeptidase YkuD (ErfK/YbiS/YcfS/YnhG family)